ncbi:MULTISPECIES: two-component regulator propeller domain-containing protein [unclassified Cellulophaga]|uniref:two-component regulator propeller domain-containing protein n=1 Tax=unclassified Cellulophaga TaxID=2634405 RepID=UPI0026E3EE38|nr:MULTISPECIES: two-component regulator propeller domain-containing protein [unclassified Cellulophaga]MDO6492713.1 two-component regulator propeller domain-containing protein [Cellulophaga sp. 2_MG-2023]MDO6495970.1 two-component regulator propeller domain-containing protein [Cellulophaga sp. 3_MG-2023]
MIYCIYYFDIFVSMTSNPTKLYPYHRIQLLTLSLFLILTAITYAQNSLKFEHLTTENGLSQSDVNVIFQDIDRFMWFGTHDGLNRYDGYNFKVFKPNAENKKSISSNLIWKIIDDKKGDLWIGTTGGGLNYFNRETEEFTTYKHDPNDDNSLKSNYVTVLFRDSSNRLWVGTVKGVSMVDLNEPTDSLKFKHYNLYQNSSRPIKNTNNVSSFFEDSKHQVWIGGINGLSKLSRDNNGDIYFQSVNHLINLPSVNVKAIAEDSYGNLMLGTSNGLYKYSPYKDTNQIELLQEGTYNAISINNNHIWAGRDNGLLEFSNISSTAKPELISVYKYDPKNPSNSLSKNAIKSLFIDHTGIIWAGANGGGVNKFDPHRKQFSHIKKSLDPNSLSNDKVRAIFEDSRQNLWIGTEGGGLNFLKKNNITKDFNQFQHFNNVNKIFAIEEIELKNKRKIFIGGEFSPGLYEIDVTNDKKLSENDLKLIPDISGSVFSILQDKEKNIWIGTYNDGVHRWLINKDGSTFTKDILKQNNNQQYSLPNNIIRDIFEDSKGNKWFATGNGLSKLTPEQQNSKNPKFITFKNNPNDDTTLSHNYILTVFECKSGTIWVGTFGGGLNKLIVNKDKTIGFKRYTEKEGLPNNVIKGILEDNQGNLWISTNNGLSKFNPTDESFQNYDVNDGLQSNEFSELTALKTKEGQLFFGGVNGFTTFYPEEIISNKIKAETVLTNFSIFNKPVAIGERINGRVILDKSINAIDKIKLKYSENNFSFEFAALHYAASRKNKYAYKLEGFDKDWIYTTSKNRYATYTNLEPGSYVLKIKASNNDYIWDETPIELKIDVTPPWWRTTLAKVLYVLLAVVLLLAFRRYTIIRSAEKHKLELDHLEKEKHEEIHRLKLEFFTNISHEFRTPLTLIKGPLDFLLKKADTISPKEAKDQYVLMRKNTDYLLRLVNQLLDFRKMDHGKMSLNLSKNNIVEFLKDVGEPFQFLSRKKNINFKINVSNESILSWFDPDAVEKIINNLLSNAFKFTPENGSIKLDIFNGKDFIKPADIDLNIDQSKYIVIQVKDSGPGIPAHRLQHIFERFYTDIGITTHVNTKGTGIGLSFTKNLVELHQGIIKVQSDSENGSTFYVWLPKDKETYQEKKELNFHEVFEENTFISKVDAESHAISFMDDIIDQNMTRSRSKLPILLIIDDNQDIRSFIKKGLGESYYVYEAENGEKGLELAKKFIPNIVITDLVMPVMDGIEFCNQIKSTQETSHIPVVMLTAKTSQEKEIEGLKTGADAYIRKPFDLELLELKLSNILNDREKLRKKFNREITLQPNEVTVTSSDETFLQNAIEIVEKHMMNSEFSVEMLVKEMNMSRSNLYLKIKELTGLSSSEFIRNIRLKRAVQLFEKSDLSVKEIMYMTGFNTASYFSKCFKKQFGVVPSKYIRINNEDTTDKE